MVVDAGLAGDRRKGLMASALGGLLLTIDVPLLKLAHADALTLITVRGLFIFTSLFVFWNLRRQFGGVRTPFINGYVSVAVASISAVASILFMQAIMLTAVANVVFILAFNPMFAALLAWLVLAERLDWATGLSIAGAIVGVGIIVFDSLHAGGLAGNLMALGVSFLLAVSITIIRRSRSDQSMSGAQGGLLAAAMTIWFCQPQVLVPESWGWLALNGLVVMPLSAALLMYAPRHVAGPVVAMFYLLETVLTPVWMWFIFGEIASPHSLIGGAIVIASLLWHSIYMLVTEGKSMPGPAVSATRPLQIAPTFRD